MLDFGALRPDSLALLLDFDGTLVTIADRPSEVMLAERTLETVVALNACLDGALAIISGRSIRDIDQLFAPWRFAVAGTHGLERRDGRGKLHEGVFDRAVLHEILDELQASFAGESGLLFEQKPGSIALHYRQRPDLAQACCDHASRVAASHQDARLLTGKMVVEVKLGRRTKGDAVFDFMAEAPFGGRRPIYAGDDETDEDAFRAVKRYHGTSIKIGNGESIADYRVPDTGKFLDWLSSLSVHLHGGQPGPGEETRPT